jgi:hypothetical protein
VGNWIPDIWIRDSRSSNKDFVGAAQVTTKAGATSAVTLLVCGNASSATTAANRLNVGETAQQPLSTTILCRIYSQAGLKVFASRNYWLEFWVNI